MQPRHAALLLAFVLACGCGEKKLESTSTAPQGDPKAGFSERAVPAGLDFVMRLLPTEQGENFKFNFYDHGAGVAAADIDGDLDDDLFFCNQLGPNALFRNNGDGTFTDVTEASGPIALDDRICVSAALNDVDNDGDQDLYVASTRGGNALFLNDGKGRFTDVTKQAGLTWVGHTQGVSFFDADGDGDLDLFLANTAGWTNEVYHEKERYYEGNTDLLELVGAPPEHNTYFRNNGDGTFTNATDEAGLQGAGWGGDVAVLDVDMDGDLDMFLCNMFGGSVLYQNDGKGRFTDVTAKTLGKTPWGAVSAKFLDYDGDGLLDLLVVDMHSDMWTLPDYDMTKLNPKRKYGGFFGAMEPFLDPETLARQEEIFRVGTKTRYEAVFFGNALYRNRGDGTYEEVSDKVGVETFWPWGIAEADYDLDGDTDVFLASGMGYPWPAWPNALLMNEGGRFVDRAKEFGIEPRPGGRYLGPTMRGVKATRSSRSAAVSDFDGDGRPDFVVSNFNERPYLYMNRWPKRSFVGFRLTSEKGARDAVGAVVRVHAGGRVFVRLVSAAGGYLAQSSKTLLFGLADAGKIDSAEILWPGGGKQVIESPAINTVHAVVERK